mgnify:CR=1 FL=1
MTIEEAFQALAGRQVHFDHCFGSAGRREVRAAGVGPLRGGDEMRTDQAERYETAMAEKRGVRGMSMRIDANGKRHTLPTFMVRWSRLSGWQQVDTGAEPEA